MFENIKLKNLFPLMSNENLRYFTNRRRPHCPSSKQSSRLQEMKKRSEQLLRPEARGGFLKTVNGGYDRDSDKDREMVTPTDRDLVWFVWTIEENDFFLI